MIHLQDKETGEALCTISDEQLQFMIDSLEEESSRDQDYFISVDLIEMWEEEGADTALLAKLRTALAGREEMEIVWSRG